MWAGGELRRCGLVLHDDRAGAETADERDFDGAPAAPAGAQARLGDWGGYPSVGHGADKLRATGGGGDSLGKGRSGFQRCTLWSTLVFLYEQVEFAPKWFPSPLANILNLVVPFSNF